MKFQSKPRAIEAVQLNWNNWNEVCEFVGRLEYPAWNIREDEVSDTCGEVGPEYIAMHVRTCHGDLVTVRHGDWIVRDADAFYPIKPELFASVYSEMPSVADKVADKVAEIENNFSYHPPKDASVFERVREKAKEFAYLIHKECPVSRERAVALTNLETSVFWANAAIARN